MLNRLLLFFFSGFFLFSSIDAESQKIKDANIILNINQDIQTSRAVENSTSEETLIDNITFDDIAEMEADNLAEFTEFNIDNLREFELEEEEMSWKDKLELAVMFLKIKTRGYRSGFLNHISQHGNEYLLGSACIATMLVAAVLKNYTNRPNALIHYAK